MNEIKMQRLNACQYLALIEATHTPKAHGTSLKNPVDQDSQCLVMSSRYERKAAPMKSQQQFHKQDMQNNNTS